MIIQITSLYAGIFAIMTVVLAIGVIRQRGRKQVSVGDAGDPELQTAMRKFGNFTEYVPIALIAILLLENQGAPGWAVHAAGTAMLVGRVLHALGLDATKGPTFGRFTGTLLTFITLLVTGIWLIYGFVTSTGY